MNEALEQLIQSLKQNISPNWVVETIDQKTIELRSETCGRTQGRVVSLDLSSFYVSIPLIGLQDSINLAVSKTLTFIRHIDSAFLDLDSDKICRHSRIVVRSIDELRNWTGRSRYSINDFPHEKLTRDVSVLYVLDHDDAVALIDYDLLINYRIGTNTIRTAAYKNMMSLLDEMSWQPISSKNFPLIQTVSVNSDLFYVSSLIVLEEFWKRAYEEIGTEVVAAIPFQDFLITCPDQPEYVEQLRRCVHRVIQTQSRLGFVPISHHIWYWDWKEGKPKVR